MLERNNRHDIQIKDINSSEYISDETSRNIFCEYFAPVFKSNNSNIANFLLRYPIKSTIYDICFNSDDILQVIHGMKDTMPHGLDIFSCFLIYKNCYCISNTSIFAISVFFI